MCHFKKKGANSSVNLELVEKLINMNDAGGKSNSLPPPSLPFKQNDLGTPRGHSTNLRLPLERHSLQTRAT